MTANRYYLIVGKQRWIVRDRETGTIAEAVSEFCGALIVDALNAQERVIIALRVLADRRPVLTPFDERDGFES